MTLHRNRPRRAGRVVATLLVLLALVATACGDDAETGVAPVDPSTDDPTPTSIAAGRGWLEGDDLDWEGAPAFEGGDGESLAEYDAASTVDRETTADDSGAPVPVEPIEPPIGDPLVPDAPLRAGAIDDADDVAAYLEYRAGIVELGVEVRELDVTDSTVISVVGADGRPVLDAIVEFRDPTAASDTPLATMRTTATGTVRWLPHAIAPGLAEVEAVVRVGDEAVPVTVPLGEPAVTVEVEAPGGVDGPVPLDVHFVLDATGSMSDEIARLRDNMTSVAQQIAALPAAPDVRFGMTVYRDEGDLFVTRTFDLTGDLDAFLAALADVVADGGGDYPESMDEALADALEKPAWRREGAVELVFLIADAPPQVGRSVQQTTADSALLAAADGVKVFPVAASGTDDQAEYVMRELAFVTGGRFVFLAYGDGSTATGEGTDITDADVDELPLDQLVVRLVEDELAGLGSSGGSGGTTTTTTIPVTTTTYEQ